MSRMEWRAVSEHTPFQTSSNEAVEYCSIKIDGGGGLSEEIVGKRIEEIRREREKLEHVEIELRARSIVRSEISEVENRFQLKIKEHADVNSQLKDQIQEREQHIHELEMRLEEKNKELHAIQLDNEAVWAKDDLLREQNQELASFRQERDNSEVERVQQMQQIHDLQDHVQEKENQILALEEQHRAAQETILFKEEQLREAQTWIARVQEMDALQSTALQAQLQERTEQFNQYWIGIQRQFAEVERHHLQTIQQLQLELAGARELSGKVARQNSEDSSSCAENKGNQKNVNEVTVSNDNLGINSNGNLDGHLYASSSTVSSENEHSSSVTVVPSVLGIGSFFPPTQVTALHPFVMHPQQPLSSFNSHIPQFPVSNLEPISIIPPHPQLQHQQAVPDVLQNPNQNKLQPSKAEQNHNSYELPNATTDQQQSLGSASDKSSIEDKVLYSDDKQYQTSVETQQTSDLNASIQPTLVFGAQEQKSEIKGQIKITVSTSNISSSPRNQKNFSIVPESSNNVIIVPESTSTANSSSQITSTHKQQPTLLDERSLLVCIVRAIPPGAVGRTRISTTLPNRLAKMLAPLHWHDYKKQYGKLDDFVARHPELFLIEGDFIHLRDGAQEIISATTAFAKVAAAASAPYSVSYSSVALTPVAQNSRDKSVPSLDSKQNGASFKITNGYSDKNISVNGEIRHVHSSMLNAVGNGTKGLTNGRKQTRPAGAGVISRR